MDREQCKHISPTHGKRCKHPAKLDGLCGNHHPSRGVSKNSSLDKKRKLIDEIAGMLDISAVLRCDLLQLSQPRLQELRDKIHAALGK